MSGASFTASCRMLYGIQELTTTLIVLSFLFGSCHGVVSAAEDDVKLRNVLSPAVHSSWLAADDPCYVDPSTNINWLYVLCEVVNTTETSTVSSGDSSSVSTVTTSQLRPRRVLMPDLEKSGTLQLSFSGEPVLPNSVTHFVANGNEFVGTLDLTRLPQSLQVLQLDHNQFHSLVDLTMLPTSLEKLYINNNRLSGAYTLRNLPPSLTDLYLQENEFSNNVGVGGEEGTGTGTGGPFRIDVDLLPQSLERLFLSPHVDPSLVTTDEVCFVAQSLSSTLVSATDSHSGGGSSLKTRFFPDASDDERLRQFADRVETDVQVLNLRCPTPTLSATLTPSISLTISESLTVTPSRTLTPSEPIPTLFITLDTNVDGLVSVEEIKAYIEVVVGDASDADHLDSTSSPDSGDFSNDDSNNSSNNANNSSSSSNNRSNIDDHNHHHVAQDLMAEWDVNRDGVLSPSELAEPSHSPRPERVLSAPLLQAFYSAMLSTNYAHRQHGGISSDDYDDSFSPCSSSVDHNHNHQQLAPQHSWQQQQQRQRLTLNALTAFYTGASVGDKVNISILGMPILLSKNVSTSHNSNSSHNSDDDSDSDNHSSNSSSPPALSPSPSVVTTIVDASFAVTVSIFQVVAQAPVAQSTGTTVQGTGSDEEEEHSSSSSVLLFLVPNGMNESLFYGTGTTSQQKTYLNTSITFTIKYRFHFSHSSSSHDTTSSTATAEPTGGDGDGDGNDDAATVDQLNNSYMIQQVHEASGCIPLLTLIQFARLPPTPAMRHYDRALAAGASTFSAATTPTSATATSFLNDDNYNELFLRVPRGVRLANTFRFMPSSVADSRSNQQLNPTTATSTSSRELFGLLFSSPTSPQLVWGATQTQIQSQQLLRNKEERRSMFLEDFLDISGGSDDGVVMDRSLAILQSLLHDEDIEGPSDDDDASADLEGETAEGAKLDADDAVFPPSTLRLRLRRRQPLHFAEYQRLRFVQADGDVSGGVNSEELRITLDRWLLLEHQRKQKQKRLQQTNVVSEEEERGDGEDLNSNKTKTLTSSFQPLLTTVVGTFDRMTLLLYDQIEHRITTIQQADTIRRQLLRVPDVEVEVTPMVTSTSVTADGGGGSAVGANGRVLLRLEFTDYYYYYTEGHIMAADKTMSVSSSGEERQQQTQQHGKDMTDNNRKGTAEGEEGSGSFVEEEEDEEISFTRLTALLPPTPVISLYLWIDTHGVSGGGFGDDDSHHVSADGGDGLTCFVDGNNSNNSRLRSSGSPAAAQRVIDADGWLLLETELLPAMSSLVHRIYCDLLLRLGSNNNSSVTSNFSNGNGSANETTTQKKKTRTRTMRKRRRQQVTEKEEEETGEMKEEEEDNATSAAEVNVDEAESTDESTPLLTGRVLYENLRQLFYDKVLRRGSNNTTGTTTSSTTADDDDSDIDDLLVSLVEFNTFVEVLDSMIEEGGLSSALFITATPTPPATTTVAPPPAPAPTGAPPTAEPEPVTYTPTPVPTTDLNDRQVQPPRTDAECRIGTLTCVVFGIVVAVLSVVTCCVVGVLCYLGCCYDWVAHKEKKERLQRSIERRRRRERGEDVSDNEDENDDNDDATHAVVAVEGENTPHHSYRRGLKPIRSALLQVSSSNSNSNNPLNRCQSQTGEDGGDNNDGEVGENNKSGLLHGNDSVHTDGPYIVIGGGSVARRERNAPLGLSQSHSSQRHRQRQQSYSPHFGPSAAAEAGRESNSREGSKSGSSTSSSSGAVSAVDYHVDTPTRGRYETLAGDGKTPKQRKISQKQQSKTTKMMGKGGDKGAEDRPSPMVDSPAADEREKAKEAEGGKTNSGHTPKRHTIHVASASSNNGGGGGVDDETSLVFGSVDDSHHYHPGHGSSGNLPGTPLLDERLPLPPPEGYRPLVAGAGGGPTPLSKTSSSSHAPQQQQNQTPHTHSHHSSLLTAAEYSMQQHSHEILFQLEGKHRAELAGDASTILMSLVDRCADELMDIRSRELKASLSADLNSVSRRGSSVAGLLPNPNTGGSELGGSGLKNFGVHAASLPSPTAASPGFGPGAAAAAINQTHAHVTHHGDVGASLSDRLAAQMEWESRQAERELGLSGGIGVGGGIGGGYSSPPRLLAATATTLTPPSRSGHLGSGRQDQPPMMMMPTDGGDVMAGGGSGSGGSSSVMTASSAPAGGFVMQPMSQQPSTALSVRRSAAVPVPASTAVQVQQHHQRTPPPPLNTDIRAIRHMNDNTNTMFNSIFLTGSSSLPGSARASGCGGSSSERGANESQTNSAQSQYNVYSSHPPDSRQHQHHHHQPSIGTSAAAGMAMAGSEPGAAPASPAACSAAPLPPPSSPLPPPPHQPLPQLKKGLKSAAGEHDGDGGGDGSYNHIQRSIQLNKRLSLQQQQHQHQLPPPRHPTTTSSSTSSSSSRTSHSLYHGAGGNNNGGGRDGYPTYQQPTNQQQQQQQNFRFGFPPPSDPCASHNNNRNSNSNNNNRSNTRSDSSPATRVQSLDRFT